MNYCELWLIIQKIPGLCLVARSINEVKDLRCGRFRNLRIFLSCEAGGSILVIYIYMRRGVHQNDSISTINTSNISFDVHFNILWRDTLLRDGTGVQVRDNDRA
jgi:hypothetical protein